MTKTKKGIIGITVALSMVLSHALTVSAVSICDMPEYQWSDDPVIMSEDEEFAISSENPLEGHFKYDSFVSECFIWTDMEEPTAEALGLPEGVTLSKPGIYDFFGLRNSYVNTDENCYRVGGKIDKTEYIDILVDNPDIDTVITETCNRFSMHATLGIRFTTAESVELTPEYFGDMMVESVTSGTDHMLFLSEEAAANGVDYNDMYNYLKNNEELGVTYVDAWGYDDRGEYDGETWYSMTEGLDTQYVYTTLKGEFTAAAEDANGDYSITLDDAVTVLQSYADNAVASEPVYNESHDANADGTVDLDDAVQILTRYANDAAGL